MDKKSVTKPLILMVLLSLVLLILPSCSNANNNVQTASVAKTPADTNGLPDLSSFKGYVKVPPYDMKDNKFMFNDSLFKEAILPLIGQERLELMYKYWGGKGFLQTGPSMQGNILCYGLAKGHDANDHQVVVFINLGSSPQDPAANTIQIFWRDFDYKTQKSDVYWFATGQSARQISANFNPAEVTHLELLKKFGQGTLAAWQISAQ